MKKFIFIGIITVGIYFLGSLSVTKPVKSIHSESEKQFMVTHFLDPVDSSFIFPSSSDCDGCHDSDDDGIANVDAQGNDINLFDQWEASMMGQSAKDPYWIAKVKHETHTFPAHKEAIETKCISCHAPLGHYTALLRGQELYTMEHLHADSLGLDGVSCGACHQMSRERFGKTFSGEMTFDTNRVIYGAYPFPFDGPMREFVGFTPKFSEHITSSSVCAPCHTLITNSFDLEGNPTDNAFVEQATYHEWLNSNFSTLGISCQNCHMPYLDDSVIISSGYENLDKRFPYAEHTLSGANTMMLELLKWFKDSLNIVLPDSLFDASILSTKKRLKGAVSLKIIDAWMQRDSMIIQMRLINRSGHKFPSGYPSRRAWVESLVMNEKGDTLLHSGQINADYSLKHIDSPMEPHFDTIRQDSDVQIYEGFMVDISETFTTVLDRAYLYSKDNRLVPSGFKKSHSVYDTTQIHGLALEDENFNYLNGNEGSGSDDLFFKVAADAAQSLSIIAKLYYQSIPPEWVEELFAIEDVHEISRFKWMYDSIQPKPELVNTVLDTFEILMTGTENVAIPDQIVSIYPNPIHTGEILNFELSEFSTSHNVQLAILNLDGKKLISETISSGEFAIPHDLKTGLYIVQLNLTDGTRLIQKIMIRQIH